MAKKKILIINKTQFGYHTDTYYYCRYLKNHYDVTYVCFDEKKEKLFEDKVNVVYVNSDNNYFYRSYKFISKSVECISNHKDGLTFIVYFIGISILSLFAKKNRTIVDIRTASAALEKVKRVRQDWTLRNEIKLYKNISIISKEVAVKLRIKKPVHVLPLGALEISNTTKKYDRLKLLYVGTFTTRKIEETIDGVARFVKEVNDDITYTIVGFGSNKEEEIIKNRIIEHNLMKNVKFEGRVTISNLKKYFDDNNIGVTYVPMTDYYKHQPPTKLFEYGLSGLINIATATEINKELINSDNGVICDDNKDSFFEAICEVQKNFAQYDCEKIRNSVFNYHWEKIITNNLIPYLELIEKR